jgi:hypothetical protein
LVSPVVSTYPIILDMIAEPRREENNSQTKMVRTIGFTMARECGPMVTGVMRRCRTVGTSRGRGHGQLAGEGVSEIKEFNRDEELKTIQEYLDGGHWPRRKATVT